MELILFLCPVSSTQGTTYIVPWLNPVPTHAIPENAPIVRALRQVGPCPMARAVVLTMDAALDGSTVLSPWLVNAQLLAADCWLLLPYTGVQHATRLRTCLQPHYCLHGPHLAFAPCALEGAQ